MAKTKYFQIATTLSRWIGMLKKKPKKDYFICLAFLLMIIIASVQLLSDGPKGHPHTANFSGFGSFFGVSVYAFMCHHSIPGLIAPIT